VLFSVVERESLCVRQSLNHGGSGGLSCLPRYLLDGNIPTLALKQGDKGDRRRTRDDEVALPVAKARATVHDLWTRFNRAFVRVRETLMFSEPLPMPRFVTALEERTKVLATTLPFIVYKLVYRFVRHAADGTRDLLGRPSLSQACDDLLSKTSGSEPSLLFVPFCFGSRVRKSRRISPD
jgi:hypothetical protein